MISCFYLKEGKSLFVSLQYKTSSQRTLIFRSEIDFLYIITQSKAKDHKEARMQCRVCSRCTALEGSGNSSGGVHPQLQIFHIEPNTFTLKPYCNRSPNTLAERMHMVTSAALLVQNKAVMQRYLHFHTKCKSHKGRASI